MDFNKNYYGVLGVLPTANLLLIKAAYKAMLKVYHPDKFNGSQAEAHAKTIEINEAYSILSNQNKRNEYDEYFGNTEYKAYSYSEESKSENDFSSDFHTLDKDWQVAIKYQPELIVISNELSKISSKLAFTYKAYIIESQEFGNKKILADEMEQAYLSLYFGSKKEIQNFAKILIIGKHRDAARELNKAITVLGVGVEVKVIIEQIKSEFNLNFTKRSEVPCDKENEDESNYFHFVMFVFFLGLIIFLSSR